MTAARVALLGCVAIACGSPGSGVLSNPRTVSRGALAYHATLVGTRLVASVELALRFELVVRRLDDGAMVELGRIDLGPPDWDTTGIAAAAAGPIVWLSSRDGLVRAVNIETMQIVRALPTGSSVTAIAVSRDGALVAYGTSGGILCLRRARDAALLQCLVDRGDEITALTFSADTLVSATSSGAISVWSAPSLRRLGDHVVAGPVAALRSDPTERRLAIAIGQRPGRSSIGRGAVTIHGPGGSVVQCRGHRDSVTSLAWLTDGRLLSGSLDGGIRLWEVLDGACEEIASRAFGSEIAFVLASLKGVLVGMWAKERRNQTAVFLDYLSESR